MIIKPAEQKPSKALSSLELMNAGINFSVSDSVMSVLGSVSCSCLSFILKFSYGSCLCHASLVLLSLCYWFPCSWCHVLIGSLVHCVVFSLVYSCHVSSLFAISSLCLLSCINVVTRCR